MLFFFCFVFFFFLSQGVLHTVSGYMLYTAVTFKMVFDYHPDDIYWCTADIGWITGHSYITYGPLSNGATSVLVREQPNHSVYFRTNAEYLVLKVPGTLLILFRRV